MKLIGMAAWLVLALFCLACGGGASGTSSPPGSVANPTLQALVEEAEQTPVEGYVREYAQQLCDPIKAYFETVGDGLEELVNEPPPRETTPEDDLEAFADELALALAWLEKPLDQLLEDMKDIDPPEELEDYHDSRVARDEHTLEMIRATNSGEEIDIFEFASAPELVDEPPGLRAALISECGPGLTEAFEQLGGDLFDSDVFGGGDDLSFDRPLLPPVGPPNVEGRLS